MTIRTDFKISEIELTYRPEIKAQDCPQISSSRDAYDLFRENWSDCTINLFEEFKVAFLNNDNRCLGLLKISQGGITGTLVDNRLIFATALKACASGLVLCHNHPSGRLDPSKADLKLTEKLVEAGNLLDIRVLDHIILTEDNYLSFGDEGLMP